VFNKSRLINFYKIKDFACKNFYVWENGNDFIWLKKEWDNFEKHLETEANAIAFICCLSDIYDVFCHAAYFEPNVSKYELGQPKHIYLSKTLDIILEVYERPEDIYREFSSIKIDWQMPHSDGRKFIYELLEEKWNEKIKNFC
tara:strand:- start:413 stop:841 length:429 start_codon:yes stop_codon:yes gene_type:complete